MTSDATRPPLDEADDRALVARHVAGDPDAFGEIFRRHRDRLWAIAVGVCGDHEMAAEAVREAFIGAFRGARAHDGDAAVTTWLHRIVVNACVDRTHRAEPAAEPSANATARMRAPDRAGSVDTRMLVHDALHRLPEAQRLALVLVDVHGVPVAEAAQILEVGAGTINSRCARGRESLADTLASAGVGPPGTSHAATSSDMEDPRGERRRP